MLPSALQLLGLALALLGVLGAGVATLSPAWRGRAAAGGGVLAAVWQQQGLWADCSWHATGVFSCALAPSVLALPAALQGARVAMVTSLLLGALGLSLAALGLKCTRWGGGRRAKGHTAVAAGGCLATAGALCLLAAGWVTSDLLQRYRDPQLPASAKQEPGGALYLAFVSAGLLLAGGGIFCLSCPGGGSPASCPSPAPPLEPLPPQAPGGEGESHRDDPPPDTPPPRERYSPTKDTPHYPPAKDTPHYSPAKDTLHYSPAKDTLHYSPSKLASKKKHHYSPSKLPAKDIPNYSPSKLPAKDIQAGYSLKDYV